MRFCLLRFRGRGIRQAFDDRLIHQSYHRAAPCALAHVLFVGEDFLRPVAEDALDGDDGAPDGDRRFQALIVLQPDDLHALAAGESFHLIDREDEPCGEEAFLLINATTLSLEEAEKLCKQHRGVAIPAHIDRESNGMLSTLGDFPEEPDFPTIEVRDAGSLPKLERAYPVLRKKRAIVSSDAHRICEIAEPGYSINLPCERGASDQDVRDALIDYLSCHRGGDR